MDFHFIEVYIDNIEHLKEVGIETTRRFPAWLGALDDEDLQFLRRFVLSSGSLKDLAAEYGVSYPTVRARLDRFIAKVQAAEDPKIQDPFERKVRLLVADMKLPAHLGKELLEAHRAALQRRHEK